MASSLVGQYQITTFTSPVNGTSPINANEVRGNDNVIKSAYDSHDNDATIHFQDSPAASRPTAGTVGRKWLDNDTLRVYYDDGATWQEIAYATSASPTFTGQVKFADGTVSAPSITFTNDTDCGLYRIGANNIGIAVNGANVLDISTSGLAVTGLLSASNGLTVTGANLNASTVNVMGSNFTAAAAGAFEWSGRGTLSASADGVFRLLNNAATDFSRLCFGAATSSFPSLKRSSTELQARLGDDSAFAPFQAATGTFTNLAGTLTTASQPNVTTMAGLTSAASLATVGTIATGVWQGTSISTTYTDAKIKTVTGTSNRLTIGGTSTDPTFDISTSYVGQATITTLGTIATGVWNGTAITDTYLATISTAGKVSNSATTATSANTASAIVARDGSGNFTAGTITAALVGNVTGNVSGSSGSTTGNAATATALQTARTIWGQSFDGTANVSGAISGATTITASGLISAQAGVTVTGANLNASAVNVSASSMTLAAAGVLEFTGRSLFTCDADGLLRLSNNAGTSFGRLQFGGTTSSFPSLKRSTTELQVRLADDSNYAPLRASAFTGDGSALTALNASELGSGTVPSGRLSGSYTGITGTGALDAGSITSNFGSINIGTDTVTAGAGTFSLDVTSRHLIGNSGTPGNSVLANAGSGASAAVFGTDTAGTIALTGGSSSSSGNMITLTFATAFAAAPYIVIMASQLTWYAVTTTTTATFSCASALSNGGNYNISYIVVG